MAASSSTRPSAERRLLWFLAGIAAIAILGVLAIVPYRLYERDVRQAEVTAHRIGSILHVALAHDLHHGNDFEDVGDLANRLQGIADLQISLRQLQPTELHPGGANTRGSSERHDTDLLFTAPPILDRDGKTWLATMRFDLSPMKRESIRLIIDLVLAVLIGSAAFSLVVFVLIRRMLLQPLHEVTHRVEAFAEGREPGPLPEFETRELATLMNALDRARRVKVGA
jgi:methyl-accepting chemotaxis protein